MSWLGLVVVAGALGSAAHGAGDDNLLPNSGFEEALSGWKAWGPRASEIARDETVAHAGKASVRLPGDGAALYTYVSLAGGRAYRLSGFYRCGPASQGATIGLSLCARGKGNGSAGARQVVLEARAADEWRELGEVIVTTRETVQSQVVLSAEGGPVWFDDLALVATKLPEWADPTAGAWDGITQTRTERPLFKELLGNAPGATDRSKPVLQVTMWAHALDRSALPESDRRAMSDADWEKELRSTCDQMGANHLGAFLLPWGIAGGSESQCFWRTDEFVRAIHTKHGLKFDAAAESSAVVARAVKLGAEVLNPKEVEQGGRPLVSPVDPAYVQACLDELKALGEQLADKPYVRAIVGQDEPSVPVFPGLRSEAGPVMRGFDAEVREKFGFGKYGMPAPADPEWRANEADHPFCGIAFNRWMADRYAAAAKAKYEAVKRLNPAWRYVPCDFWLMSGMIPFDIPRLAKYADMLQGDPYASSAERTRGRGLYNHGFGAKLLADLGRGSRRTDPKPVEIIVQAFDYAGYQLTPDDLLEWCSQALRCGATSLNFYASDAPRFNEPRRWQMMLHIAKTVGEMPALKLPTETKTAILYCSTAHAAEGPYASGDEVYTAYALLGEKLGCWFDLLSDQQLDRGLRKLSDYRIIYLPLATYAEPKLAEALEAWVKAGGVLVCGDPDAFSWAPDGTDTSATRERICGANVTGPKETWSVIAGDKRITLFPRRCERGRQPTARAITLGSDKTEVLGKYPDSSPAVVRRALEKGKVIYFAANPFTPESLFKGAPWAEVLRGFEKDAGEEMGLDIWRFKLPSPQQSEAPKKPATGVETSTGSGPSRSR
jgi:hypothetical protein